MLPEFNEHGNLPPGIHRAALAEIDERFGRGSEVRRVQMQSLRWLVDLASTAGVRRLIINGSFVTEMLEPNDVDCLLLVDVDYPVDSESHVQLDGGLPFLHVQLVRQSEFEFLAEEFFATDKWGNSKGMVEVVL